MLSMITAYAGISALIVLSISGKGKVYLCMTSIEKIDRVLAVLTEAKHTILGEITMYSLADLEAQSPVVLNELHEIIHKLIKDGYARPQTHPDGWVGYIATFEGMLFKEQGGYKGQLRKQSTQKQLNTLEHFLLTLGTLAAGVYALKEMIYSEAIRNILLTVLLAGLVSYIMLIALQRRQK